MNQFHLTSHLCTDEPQVEFASNAFCAICWYVNTYLALMSVCFISQVTIKVVDLFRHGEACEHDWEQGSVLQELPIHNRS